MKVAAPLSQTSYDAAKEDKEFTDDLNAFIGDEKLPAKQTSANGAQPQSTKPKVNRKRKFNEIDFDLLKDNSTGGSNIVTTQTAKENDQPNNKNIISSDAMMPSKQ